MIGLHRSSPIEIVGSTAFIVARTEITDGFEPVIVFEFQVQVETIQDVKALDKIDLMKDSLRQDFEKFLTKLFL